ncbi:hypothetical protein [Flavobacterium pallidum]|uniref:hypothetical protein n=1 Tax=Flavobacterium pallidum TaxID=2172098 RepID=UPI0011B2845E|nr:hypothetical protein [Flavobacterium pallidum]
MNESIYYVDKDILDLIEINFEFVEAKSWYKLYQNKTDKSFWRLDIWDKYQTQFFLKLETIFDWENFDARELEINLLKKTRGVTEEKCKWQNCQNKALNNLVFCEKHAYKEMGIRK